jgi:hypothetical protein
MKIFWQDKKGWPLDKGDCLIKETAWTGLTVPITTCTCKLTLCLFLYSKLEHEKLMLPFCTDIYVSPHFYGRATEYKRATCHCFTILKPEHLFDQLLCKLFNISKPCLSGWIIIVCSNVRPLRQGNVCVVFRYCSLWCYGALLT